MAASSYCCDAFVIAPPPSRRSNLLSHFAATTTTSPLRATSLEQQELQGMTVKELRQKLKDANLQQRGLLSRLKRKQDLVDYLSQHLDSQDDDSKSSSSSSNSGNAEKQNTSTTTRAKAPLRMPPLAQTASYSHSPKDVLFEHLYEQYPTLKRAAQGADENDDDDSSNQDDVRQLHHPMLRNATTSDMDIVFLGTASCTPSVTRGVSCTALRLNWRRRCLPTLLVDDHRGDTKMPEYSSFTGGTWLFDVGECTQLQIQRTTSVKPSKITKIFLTHAHGDHTFGLPGLLCLMGQHDRRDAPPVEIYGPEGLRTWLRVAIRYSVSRIVPPYRVHQLMDVPMAPEWEQLHQQQHSRRTTTTTHRFFYRMGAPTRPWRPQGLAGEDPDSWITRCGGIDLPLSSQFGEMEGGRDIFPTYDHPLAYEGAPVWEVEDEDDVRVYAAPMSHSVPCVGYVVEEQSRPGRLRNEYVEPIVKRNLKALKEAGFSIPMKAMAVIKNLPEGSSFSFPDGTVVTQEDAVEPPRSGRKIVICGDTVDARALTNLAQHADVLVHEATNTYLPGIDKDTDLKAVTKDAILHGHSTPHMAGQFAKTINSKRLILNHFSARYKGDATIDSISLMHRIEGQAIKASSLDETKVAAAWDMMMLPVPQN